MINCGWIDLEDLLYCTDVWLDKDKVWELRHTKDNRKLYNNRPPPPAACDCEREPAAVVVLVVLYVKEVWNQQRQKQTRMSYFRAKHCQNLFFSHFEFDASHFWITFSFSLKLMLEFLCDRFTTDSQQHHYRGQKVKRCFYVLEMRLFVRCIDAYLEDFGCNSMGLSLTNKNNQRVEIDKFKMWDACLF